MPVPELPRSSIFSGSDNPLNPLPFIISVSVPIPSISAPRAIIALAEFIVSSAERKPVIFVLPSAIPPIITILWDMDLSPETVISPFNAFVMLTLIVFN